MSATSIQLKKVENFHLSGISLKEQPVVATGQQVRASITIENENEENQSSSTSTIDVLQEDDIEYPESNYRRWLIVCGAWVGLVPTWGIANCMGVIQTEILENQLANVSTPTVSWIFSICSSLGMLCTIFSGTYFDRNGTQLPLMIGSSLCVLSLGLLGNCTKLYQFVLCFGVCYGTGKGIVMAPIIGCVSQYFSKKQRATAIGIAGTGGCVGGVFFPIMLRETYPSLGFKWSMRLVALLDLICLGTACLTLKERHLVPREHLSLKESVKLYLTKSFDLNALLTDKRYLFNALGCVFSEMSIIITNSYFSFITVKSGYSEKEAFLLVTLTNAFSIFGRYFAGLLADKLFGSYNIIIACSFLIGITDLVVWLPFQSNIVALWIYSILFGLFYGGVYSLLPNCCSQVVRTDKFGSRYATMYAVAGLVLLAFFPASSSVIGDGYNKSRTSGFIAFAAGLSFLSGCFYLTTRTMTVGLSLKKF